jgi:putative acyl-CoA dehydrogenase
MDGTTTRSPGSTTDATPQRYGPPAGSLVNMSVSHTVTNQPPPLVGYDVFTADTALVEGVHRHGAGWSIESLTELGRRAGSHEAQEWGRLANEFPPTLRTHDRYGNRIDEVEFHPSWHSLMTVAVGAGLHASPWVSPGPGAHVARAAGFATWSQVEGGHGCPISMTHAAVPALRADAALADEWVPRLTSYRYDVGLRAPAVKAGCLAGMGMTERQGGSDVRVNTTIAAPAPDGTYRLTGHKWFTSAPMCDVFLVLAQAPGGLSCFVVPRVLPDGERNVFRINRLKDKLGNRSNASSEPEFEETVGWRLGDEGRGVATIIAMVTMTRLDCVIGSASLMRAAVSQATHHTRHRRAFGEYLVDQPLMRAVLADLAVESEAATALMLRLAAAVDDGESELQRLALAVGKYWVCKRGPAVAAEALECLGGNGFVEDFPMARLYREAPLNSIWEGSGNVNALDVLRALGRSPGAWEAFRDEVALGLGADRHLDAAVAALETDLCDTSDIEVRARRLVERMALVLQGSLLVRFAPPAVADAFCASRLGGDWGHAFGTLPPGTDTRSIVERAAPKVG